MVVVAICTFPTLVASLIAAPAHGCRSPAAVAPKRAAPTLVLPGAAALAATSTAPTLLGFWKSEYGVSYAYGAAMAAAGAMHLQTASPPLATAHAACVLAYGVRLNVFLLYRELAIPRFREFREKIEERAVSRGSRLARAPFVLSCSLLYYCMSAPVLLTAQFAPATGTPAAAGLAGLVVLMFVGFSVAALGDLTKTWVKARQGEDHLVTTGVFRLLRHPNYTGELLLWTANAAAAVVALAGASRMPLLAKLGWLAAAITGAAGISFVLLSAAGNLEAKQAERYADDPRYKAWLAGSWAGPVLRKKPAEAEAEVDPAAEGSNAGEVAS